MKLSNKLPEENWIMHKQIELSNSSIGPGVHNIAYNEKYVSYVNLEENTSSNRTVLQAHNQFLKETNEVSPTLTETVVSGHSFTTVITIASIFLFLTTSITATLVVFCRKRNSVFALQKSEQEDAEFELDDLNSDQELEFTETEIESEVESIKSHKSLTTHMMIESDFENSPVRKPLMSAQHESEIDDSLLRQPVFKGHGGAIPKPQYKKLNAVGHNQFDAGSTTKYFKNKGNKYKMIISYSSNSDPEMQIHITNKMTDEQNTAHENKIQGAGSSYSHNYGQCKCNIPNQEFTYERLVSTDKTGDNHAYVTEV